MTDTEIVIPQFGQYVNFASTVGALPGGLACSMGHKMQKQGAEVVEDPGIFRPGKSVIFDIMRH